MTTSILIAIVFGVLFISIILFLSLKLPNPTPTQFFTFRVVLALAAAGIGATIPGILDIKGTIQQLTIGAGGAIALFILVYLVNPPNVLFKMLNRSTS